MKVDGRAFRKAREEIRKFSDQSRGTRGNPAKGTISWLAKESDCSEKTIRNLEKGVASSKTLNRICLHLNINPHQYIVDYGIDEVTCGANGVADFRPAGYPYDKGFEKTPFVLTIDPFFFKWEPSDLWKVTLKTINIEMIGLSEIFKFSPLYVVSLTPNIDNWLGCIGNPEYLIIDDKSEEKIITKSFMFKQLDEGNICSWLDFIKEIKTTKNNQIFLEITFVFDGFSKTITKIVSIEILKLHMERWASIGKKIPHRLHCSLLGY